MNGIVSMPRANTHQARDAEHESVASAVPFVWIELEMRCPDGVAKVSELVTAEEPASAHAFELLVGKFIALFLGERKHVFGRLASTRLFLQFRRKILEIHGSPLRIGSL